MNSDPFIEPINRAIDQGTAVVTFAADSPRSPSASRSSPPTIPAKALMRPTQCREDGRQGEYARPSKIPAGDNHDKRITAFIARMEEKWPDALEAGRPRHQPGSDQDYIRACPASSRPIRTSARSLHADQFGDRRRTDQQEAGGKVLVMCADVITNIADMIKAGEVFGSINQTGQGYMGFIPPWRSPAPGTHRPDKTTPSARASTR